MDTVQYGFGLWSLTTGVYQIFRFSLLLESRHIHRIGGPLGNRPSGSPAFWSLAKMQENFCYVNLPPLGSSDLSLIIVCPLAKKSRLTFQSSALPRTQFWMTANHPAVWERTAWNPHHILYGQAWAEAPKCTYVKRLWRQLIIKSKLRNIIKI